MSKEINGKLCLINDKAKHKVLYSIDGRSYKLTIADIDEMGIEEATKIVDELNDIKEARYSYSYLAGIQEAILDGFNYMPYSYKAIEIAIKLLYEEEAVVDKEEIDTVLNIGGTAAGKTTSIINSIVLRKYRKVFIPLISIKETTNFKIEYLINMPKYDVGNQVWVEAFLKDDEIIKKHIEGNISEAIEEFFAIIYKDIKEVEFEELWDVAKVNAYNRLKTNKEKSFDISYTYNFNGQEEELKSEIENMIVQLEKSLTESASYDKCSVREIKNTIRLDALKMEQLVDTDFRLGKLLTLKEFQQLADKIYYGVKARLEEFRVEYNLDDIQNIISMKIPMDNVKEARKKIGKIFADKSRHDEEKYFTISSLISNARVYLPKNPEIKWNKPLKIVDSLGINQGDKSKSEEKTKIIFNRVREAVQQSNPNWIIYHTRLEAKDEHLQNVIRKLCEEGYAGRISISYGRVDEVIEEYCEKNGLEEDELTDKERAEMEVKIIKDYVDKDIEGIRHLISNSFYLCNKKDKMVLDEKYTPTSVLNSILDKYQKDKATQEHRLTEEQKDRIMALCNKHNIFRGIKESYIEEIQESIPLVYQKLRWNVLECALGWLYANSSGYDIVYPAFSVKECFAQQLKHEDFKKELGQDYDEFLKTFLKVITDMAHIMLITTYKNKYKHLLNIRYNYTARTMPYMTMTDERKYILREMFKNRFVKQAEKDNGEVFRALTELALEKVVLLK